MFFAIKSTKQDITWLHKNKNIINIMFRHKNENNILDHVFVTKIKIT
jgi:hypothetical protein